MVFPHPEASHRRDENIEKISESNPEKGEERKFCHFGNRPTGWESFSATHAPDVTTGDALSEFFYDAVTRLGQNY